MIDNEQLKTLIDWPVVLAQPRYAGGHEEVMRNIFGPRSEVIAWWSDNDYQGVIAIAHRILKGTKDVKGAKDCIVVMTDYYGSCSGCDAWEGADDETARNEINNLVQHAKIFSSVLEAVTWLQACDPKNCPWEFPLEPAKELIPELEKLLPKSVWIIDDQPTQPTQQ